MEIKENPEENPENLRSCPLCGKRYPVFDKNGRHNFVPASLPDSTIINICLKCKQNEGKTLPHQPGWLN